MGVTNTTVKKLRVVSDALGEAFNAIYDARMQLHTFFINTPIQWDNVDWTTKTYTVDNRVHSFKDWFES